MPKTIPWEAKVHPRVLAAAPEAEQELLIVLRDQADLSGARNLPSKLAKGRYVYEQLTAAARRAQKPLLADLEARRIPYRSFWITNMIVVRGRASLVQSLARRPEVARIEPNPSIPLGLLPPESEPAVPGRGTAAIEAPASGPEPSLTLVGAPQVWAAGFTGQGTVVAGADTGFDWIHPALKGKYRGWNGTIANHDYNWHDAVHDAIPANICGSDAVEPCDDDDQGHGTHTMGTMVGDDGAGNQIGMAPGAKWIGCRNMDRGNGTPARYTECFQWFLAPTDLTDSNPDPAKAPDVINNSWGCPPSEGCTNPDTLKAIVENVRAAGIEVVVAAGNSGPACGTMYVPEIYDASFSVGATNATDQVASFSSRGPGENGLQKPEVIAPGTSIRSSVPGGLYASMTGTSMASPHVAGMVALLLSAKPALSGNVTGLEVLMEQTAVPKTTTDSCGGIDAGVVPNDSAGYGRIDAFAAYTSAVAPNVPPTVSLTSPSSGAKFYAPATIPIAATAGDTGGGSVVRVDFFSGSTKITTLTAAPYTYDWSGVAVGDYTLTAVATDNQGASTTSATVAVSVTPGSQFFTLTPCRVVDTRNPAGPNGGPALAAAGDRVFTLPGQCGIPAEARAVSVNVTVTQPTAAGDLRLSPSGASLPPTSTINYAAGQTRANNAVPVLGVTGGLAVHCDQASGTVHLIIDVNGYFQ